MEVLDPVLTLEVTADIAQLVQPSPFSSFADSLLSCDVDGIVEDEIFNVFRIDSTQIKA